LSECKVNHSHEDVKNKFESQTEFLPNDLVSSFQLFFEKENTQLQLNEAFHLLKKYDLATDEEKKARNDQLFTLLKNV
jgi:hypothetical protein